MVDKANFFAQCVSIAASSGSVGDSFKRPVDSNRLERQLQAREKALFNLAKISKSEIESQTTPSDLPEGATRDYGLG